MKKRAALDPESWSFDQLRRYLRTFEGHSQKYIYTQLNALKYMARDWDVVLQGDPDEIHDSFLDYVDARRTLEQDPEDALNNCQKAMKNLFKAFGLKHKYRWVKIRRKQRDIRVYDEATAYRIINHTYSDDPVINALYQYMAHFAHYVGPRVPSELFYMKVDDIILDERKIRFWQPKVRKYRTVTVEPFIITSPVDKSLKNYLEHWRPKALERGDYSGDRLWLNGRGYPIKEDYTRQELSRHGKQECPYFYPYLMRHFCATYRIIQSIEEKGVADIVWVNMFMDHATLDQTAEYVDLARAMLQQQGNENRIRRIRR